MAAHARAGPGRAPAGRPAGRRGPGRAGGTGELGFDRPLSSPPPATCSRPNRRIARGDEVTLGRLGPGSSVVAAARAIRRSSARSTARWRRGAWLALRRASLEPASPTAVPLLGRVRVLRRYQLQSSGSGRTGVLATVAGAPWLVRSGDVVLLGSRLDPAWTELPLSAGFMPFMDALLNRLARGEVSLADGAPGDPMPLPDLATEVRQGERELAGRGRRHVPARRTPASTTCSRAATRVGAITPTSIPASRCSRPPRTSRPGSSGRARGWSSLADAGDAAFSAGGPGRSARPAALGRARAGAGRAGARQPAGGGRRMKLRPITRRLRPRAGHGRIWRTGCPARGAALRLAGLHGSSGAVLAAWLAATLPQRLLTVVAPTPAEAERWLADLAHLTDDGVALYPQREALGEDEPHYEIAGERAETLEALLQGRLRMLVTTARATAERTLVPAALDRLRLRLVAGERRAPGEVARALEAHGLSPGAHGHRGGRVQRPRAASWTSTASGWRRRCGWSGGATRSSSLRGFDLTTQRSRRGAGRDHRAADQHRGGSGTERRRRRAGSERGRCGAPCSELLPVRHAPGGRGRRPRRRRSAAGMEGGRAPPRDRPPPGRGRARAGRPSSSRPDALARRLADFPGCSLRDERADLQFGFFPPEKIDRDLNRLRALLAGTPPTLILCDNEGQLERLDELLEEGDRAAPRATLAIGALDGGFVMPTLRVLTDHEIFRRERRLRRAAALPPGGAVGRDRRAQGRRLRRAPRARRRDLPRHRDDLRRRERRRSRRRRVRGRRPAQRAAVPHRSDRAVPRRGRGRRPAAAAAAPARRQALGAAAREDARRRSRR